MSVSCRACEEQGWVRAAFEAGVSGLSILAEYEMTKHGHRRVARLGQAIDVAERPSGSRCVPFLRG
jgi:hypothetical protein